MNLLFIDKNINELNTFINSCNNNTKFIIYDNNDNLEIIKKSLQNLNINNFDNIAFVFSNDYKSNKLFVDDKLFISHNDVIDTTTNTYTIIENDITIFIKYIVDLYSVKNIDFLACNLLNDPLWKSYFEFVQNNSLDKNITVRGSNDLTGNLSLGGDWILETTNEDVTALYFNENIEYWNYLLDNEQSSPTFSLLTLDNSNNLYTAGENGYGQLGRYFVKHFTNDFAKPNDPSKLQYSIYNKKIVDIDYFFLNGNFSIGLLTDELSNNLYVFGHTNNGNLGIDINSVTSPNVDITGSNETTGWFTNVLYNRNTPLINKKIIYISVGNDSILALSDETSNNLYGVGMNLLYGISNKFVFTNMSIYNNILNNKTVIHISHRYRSASAIVTNESSNNLYTMGDRNIIGFSTATTFQQVFTNKNDSSQFFLPNKKVLKARVSSESIIVITDETSNNLYTTGYDFNGLTLRGITTNTYTTSYTNLRNDGTPIISKKVLDIHISGLTVIVLTNEVNNNIYIGGTNFYTKYSTLINTGITFDPSYNSLDTILSFDLSNNVPSYYYLNNTNNLNNLYYSGYTYYAAIPYLNRNDYDMRTNLSGSISQINPTFIKNTGTVNSINTFNNLNNRSINKIKTFYNSRLAFVITNDTSNNLYISGIDNNVGGDGASLDKFGLNTRQFSNKILNLENKKIIRTFNSSSSSCVITDENTNNLYLSGLQVYSGYFISSIYTNKGFQNSSISNGFMINKKVIDARSSSIRSNSSTTYYTTYLLTNETSNNLYVSSSNNNSGNIVSYEFKNANNSNVKIFNNKKVISLCNSNEDYDSTNNVKIITGSVLTNETSNNLYFVGTAYAGMYGSGNFQNSILSTTFRNTRLDTNEPLFPNKKIIKSITSQLRTLCITDEESNNLYVSGANGNTGALGTNGTSTIYTFVNPYNTIENDGSEFKNKKIIDIYISSLACACITNESSNNVYVAGNIDNAFLGLTTNNNSFIFVSLTKQAISKSSPLLSYILNKKITNIQIFVNSYINYILDFKNNQKNIILGRVNSATSIIGRESSGFIGYNYEYNFNSSRTTIPVNTNRLFTNDISGIMTQPFIDRSLYHSFQLNKNNFTNLSFEDNNVIYTPVPTDSISIINHLIINNNVDGITNVSNYFTLEPIESYLNEHISFDVNVLQYKNIEIYSKNYKDEISFIPITNSINNEIYYTHNISEGKVKIYCKYFSTIIIKTIIIPPSLNVLNVNQIANVYDVSFDDINYDVSYPDSSSNALNQINIKSTTPSNTYSLSNNKIKGYLQLYPENTLLTKHLYLNMNVPIKRAFDIYYVSNNNIYLIPKTNNISNDYYYTYNPFSGLINIKTKQLKNIYIVEKEPIIEVLSNVVSNINISSNNSVLYNTEEDISNNLIRFQSSNIIDNSNNYNITKIKNYINLYPPNTIFTEHINFDINVDSFKSYNVFFKSQSDVSPYLISKYDNSSNDVYYTYDASGFIKIYTKHFSEIFISEKEPITEIINNNVNALVSNFIIPLNNSITYSNNLDVSNNKIVITSLNQLNQEGIDKQLVYVNLNPFDISISGEHISFDISLNQLYKPINVFYKSINDNSFNILLDSSNNISNDIYYYYNPSSGLINIYTKKVIELIINENEPIINIINNNANSTLSNFNYNTNYLTYPNSQTTLSNIITLTSSNDTSIYNIQNVKSRIILEPSGTQFTNHISYSILLPENNNIKVYFKRGNDLNPIEILSNNTNLNDVYYTYNQITRIATIYTKHFSESLIVQEPIQNNSNSNNSVNFYMQQFNYIITMNTGLLDIEIPEDSVTDAVAHFYVKTQDMKNVFMFQTDSTDVDSNSINDIKYFVRMSQWPEGLIINPCHSWVQVYNQIATSDKNGLIPDNKQLVKHDFIRYIAKELFNTHLGVGLFLNEDVLKYDLAYKGHYNVWNDIKTSLTNVDSIDLSTNLFTSSMYGIDPSYGKYLTNDASGNNNLCRKLINQILYSDPSRFKNLNNIAIDASNGYYYVPFADNDTISFILVLNPAQNQHKIVNRNTPISPRTYKIKINIKDNVTSSVNHTNSSNVIVNDGAPSKYLGQNVTENLNNSYPSNYIL